MAKALSRKKWGLGLLKGQRVGGSKSEKQLRVFFTASLLGLCLVGLALAHVWVRLQVVQLGYVLSTTSKLQNQLEQENRELRVELATLTSPERLEAMARKRLGLAGPTIGQVVILP